MSFLFGHLYDAPCKFTHDQAMFRKKGVDTRIVSEPESKPPQDPTEQPAGTDADYYERGARASSSDASFQHRPNATASRTHLRGPSELARDHDAAPVGSDTDHPTKKRLRSDGPSKSEHAVPSDPAERKTAITPAPKMSSTTSNVDSGPLSSYEYSEAWKQQAFEAAQGTGSTDWNDITLVSVFGHQEHEEEL